MYRVIFQTTRAAHFIKKADSYLKEEIENEIKVIAGNPHSAEELHGKFKGIRSHHFSFRGVQYRIAYSVYDDKSVVAILHIGTREKFYAELVRVI